MRGCILAILLGFSASGHADSVTEPDGPTITVDKFHKTDPGPSEQPNHDRPQRDSGPRGPRPPSWKELQARQASNHAKGVEAYRAAQRAWAIHDDRHLDEALRGFETAYRLGVGEAAAALAQAENAKGVRLYEAGKRAEGFQLVYSAKVHAPGAKRYEENLEEMRTWLCSYYQPLIPQKYTDSDDHGAFEAATNRCTALRHQSEDVHWNCPWDCGAGDW